MLRHRLAVESNDVLDGPQKSRWPRLSLRKARDTIDRLVDINPRKHGRHVGGSGRKSSHPVPVLAQGIIDVLSDSHCEERMSIVAREFADSFFGWSHFVELISKVYHSTRVAKFGENSGDLHLLDSWVKNHSVCPRELTFPSEA